MNKQETREYIKRLRNAFPDKKEASEKIVRSLLEQPEIHKAETVALFCSMPEEVQTDDLILRLLEEGKEVCVPLIREKTMHFIKISGLDELVSRGSFGIREPLYDPEKLIPPEKIDTAIFPGLAFDPEFHRLGYGGGYYDAYFASAPQAKRIAAAFSCQILDHVPCEEHDLKMDKIITEDKLYSRE